MASQLGIYNLALMRMGQPPLTTPTDVSKAADALNSIWATIVDIVLRDHPWNFAIARANLAKLSETPAWGFTTVFQLPSDCVRILGIGESGDVDTNPLLTYKIEGRKLYTDETSVLLKYVRRVEIAGEFDACFASTLAARLAMETAFYLTQSPDIEAKMYKWYLLEISGARGIDAQEDTPQYIISGDWELARG